MVGQIGATDANWLALDRAAVPADAVKVGKVADAWGVQGAVKIYPYSADPVALLSSRKWFLSFAPLPSVGAGIQGLVKVKEVKKHGSFVVAKFEGVNDRDAAAGYKGAEISVPRSGFPTAGPDEFYWIDLIGLQVVNIEGVQLGTIDDLISNGPQTVLVIKSVVPGGQVLERLIPFVSHYVTEVDKAMGIVRVDWQPDF